MLPNPGFDADSFDNDAFDTGLPFPEMTGVSRRREGSEWYTCDRCGIYYPREMMMVQNGLTLCVGPATTNCVDLPGHAAAVAVLDVPFEERPEPLPYTSEEL